VARYLLEHGLPGMSGVVFLDEQDHRMVLLRNGWRVVRLRQCGLPLDKRFTFYDQVWHPDLASNISAPSIAPLFSTVPKLSSLQPDFHSFCTFSHFTFFSLSPLQPFTQSFIPHAIQIHTTGMDIKQALHAHACLTLGKDMVFRDYAQGAFRMRGIGQGQVISMMVIPEVERLIATQVRKCEMSFMVTSIAGQA
jgi:hypothetical protein